MSVLSLQRENIVLANYIQKRQVDERHHCTNPALPYNK